MTSYTNLRSVLSRFPPGSSSGWRLATRASAVNILCLTAYLLPLVGCRQSAQPGAGGQSRQGQGPEHYTARIVRTAEQNGAQQTVEYRIAVSGQMIREDWVENGEQRALIVRPDSGEAYLLFPDKGEYFVETPEEGGLPTNGGPTAATQVNRGANMSKAADNLLVDPVEIESDMSPGTTAGEGATDVALPDATVDGHPCRVSERRSILSDGTTEIMRTYKATDLEGLPIRIESESEGKNGRVRVVTETRDIQPVVPQGAFDLPSELKQKQR